MKRIIGAIVASIVVAAGMSVGAQERTNAQFLRVEGIGQAPSVQFNCNVNGVVYPVDYANNIWGINPANSLWFIIGHLYPTPNGFVAINYLGQRFAAFCG